MAVRSRLLSSFLFVVLTGCAGNQTAENALKPDATLRSQPEAAATPIAQPSELPKGELPKASPTPQTAPSPTSTNWQDPDKLPSQLKPYVEDLLALNLLTPERTVSESDRLNTPISRREFAKWLVFVNNRFYQSKAPKQIRIDRPSSTPAFQDIPTTDPDFAIIQSLAEAGILPSSLSGDEKITQFRPAEPLTREDLLRWKIPLDVRSSQTTTIDPKSLPFQDLVKLNNPETLKAIALDLQNGDHSNLRRSLGYTKLLQPQRSVTRAEAMAALWSIGSNPEVLTAKEVLTTASKPVPDR